MKCCDLLMFSESPSCCAWPGTAAGSDDVNCMSMELSCCAFGFLVLMSGLLSAACTLLEDFEFAVDVAWLVDDRGEELVAVEVGSDAADGTVCSSESCVLAAG